ncbi:VOC family protein [Solimonas flava]|uniref:VOC family protein n=1 Tax=Solimonas flava TaxID=415849 RepID=UPI00042A8ECD|nr:VOC family protein [Solimonas flava]
MRNVYAIVTTPEIRACCDFYRRALDARIVFRADWYAHISFRGWELGFLKPHQDAPLPVFQHTTTTRGLCIALETENVQADYEQLLARGLAPLGPMREFANGERSFALIDPAGTVLNFVEHRPHAADGPSA